MFGPGRVVSEKLQLVCVALPVDVEAPVLAGSGSSIIGEIVFLA